jgi:hypothetical protein
MFDMDDFAEKKARSYRQPRGFKRAIICQSSLEFAMVA